ncbi:MAG TPA: hypothetical protein VG267_00815 [Terracidiphilus sp.]|jgi:hypothetical protein|nr:hypothetical protein [Terracidiphilus sp.]
MVRTYASGLLMLCLAVPTFAKPKTAEPVKGVYPVSCDDLWAAVKNTLGNRANYALESVNDLDLHASFIVIGDLIVYTDRVTLIPKEGGCSIKEDIGEVGAENVNWRAFHKRLGQSLAKMRAAKSTGAVKSPETASSPGVSGQQ